MEMRSLGATGERVSALCMGCWEIGGQAWGDFPAWDGVRLVQQAFDAGITTFDTAEVYGNGRSEVLLGEALYGRRDDAFIISKVGYLPGTDGAQSIQGAKQPRDYSPKRIRDACDLALRRLRTEYIDAYLLHDPPLAHRRARGAVRRAAGTAGGRQDPLVGDIRQNRSAGDRRGSHPALGRPSNRNAIQRR